MIILHAVLEEFWNNYTTSEYYGEKAIQKDGFIHCSTSETIIDVANSNFKTWGKMLLLSIDSEKVIAEIKWEDLQNCGIKFPHIYGLLNTNAIIEILEFNRNSNNEFLLPEQLRNHTV